MRGSTPRPGITQSDATEKPVARARAGMASDRPENTAGASTASAPEITQLTATATTMLGASANAAASTAAAIDTLAPTRVRPATLPV